MYYRRHYLFIYQCRCVCVCVCVWVYNKARIIPITQCQYHSRSAESWVIGGFFIIYFFVCLFSVNNAPFRFILVLHFVFYRKKYAIRWQYNRNSKPPQTKVHNGTKYVSWFSFDVNGNDEKKKNNSESLQTRKIWFWI